MTLPNTRSGLADNLKSAGLKPGQTVIVHASLSKVGYTVGGAVAVIQAFLDVLGESGTLVMPAESPQLEDPDSWTDKRIAVEWHGTIREHLPVFDKDLTPTTMGTIAETFRRWPGTLRSNHPTVSVCARGPLAEALTRDHPLAFCEGPGSPFEKLYETNAMVLLLGVGFDRCTLLHFAESLTRRRRTTTSRLLIEVDGKRVWIDAENMATDGGVLFPAAGELFIATTGIERQRIGDAPSWLFPAADLVDVAKAYFEQLQAT